MSSFDLRRLRYFVTVAEMGSVTRAAGELHIAQPALSYQIHQLEEELGVQLFARGSQGVTLTEAGRELANESRAILGQIRSLRNRLKDHLREDPEGIVVIGVAQTISLAIAVPMLERAVAELPHVQVQLREVMSSEIPALVRSESLDFAVSYAVPSGYGISSMNVLSEDLFLFGNRRSAVKYFGARAESAQILFSALQDIPLYLSARSNGFRDELEHVARTNKVRFNVAAEVDSVALRKELAINGDSFTISSGAAIRKEVRDPDIYAARIVKPALRRNVCFVRKSGSALSRASHRLATILAETLTEAVSNGSWSATIHSRELAAAIEQRQGGA